MRKSSILVLLLMISITFIVLFNLIPNVSCITESFPVPALGSISKNVSMRNGEYVTGSFSVSGARNKAHNKIVFKVNDPDGIEIYDYRIEGPTYDGVSTADFTIIAPTTGNYDLVFDNTRLRFSENLIVKLDYSVKKLILGFTQETLFLIAAAIVIVTVVGAAFLVYLVKSKKTIKKAK